MKTKAFISVFILLGGILSTLSIFAKDKYEGDLLYTVGFDNKSTGSIVSLIDTSDKVQGVKQLGINPLTQGISGPYPITQSFNDAGNFKLRIVNQTTHKASVITLTTKLSSTSDFPSQNCLKYVRIGENFADSHYACMSSSDTFVATITAQPEKNDSHDAGLFMITVQP